MRKGKEILTIAELKEAMKTTGFFRDNEYQPPMEKYVIHRNFTYTYYKALPDYKELTQRVFDGIDRMILTARTDERGYLYYLTGEDNKYLDAEYKPNQEINRDLTSDGYTLDEAIQFNEDGILEYKFCSGWDLFHNSAETMKDALLSNYRKKPESKPTYTLSCNFNCNINL
jgi:hypothetical protein